MFLKSMPMWMIWCDVKPDTPVEQGVVKGLRCGIVITMGNNCYYQ